MELTFPSANRELKHFDAAARVLNRFHWNVSIEDAEGELRLFGGEVLVGRFKSMAELETFTAGLALALHVLPPEVATMIDEWAGA